MDNISKMISTDQTTYWDDHDTALSHQGGYVSSSESPLGLRLSKTPSFLNLVQKTMSKDKSGADRLKAANFPATSIKIGNWQRLSSHEGDLTVKIYFAKRKIVWELLEGAFKRKIEIQWSDISAIRAITLPNHPGLLEIQLGQPPLFFEEVNPQPKKHTIWKASPDFTGGEAPVCRIHVVRFEAGILDRHYEKLLLCNQRLLEISQKPFPSNESPYFDSEMPGTSINFKTPYQYTYLQSYSDVEFPYTNMSVDTQAHSGTTPHWEQGCSYDGFGNESRDYYQLPNVGYGGNHLLGDQSHVPSHYDDQSAAYMGSMPEATGAVEPSYSYLGEGREYCDNYQGNTTSYPPAYYYDPNTTGGYF